MDFHTYSQERRDNEKWAIAHAMQRRGGSFVQALGKALDCADSQNIEKIKETWSDYWAEYRATAIANGILTEDNLLGPMKEIKE